MRTVSAVRLPNSWDRERHEHASLLTTDQIRIAVERTSASFFEPEGNQHIGSYDDCEQQKPLRHIRRSPEGDQKTDHDRMSDDAIQQWRLEGYLGIGGDQRS